MLTGRYPEAHVWATQLYDGENQDLVRRLYPGEPVIFLWYNLPVAEGFPVEAFVLTAGGVGWVVLEDVERL
jgi:hypothetical protein